MEIHEIISTAAGVISVILFVIFRQSTQKYIDEKARNLATIQDTAQITAEVEKVKTEYLMQSHVQKQIFEKEYALLKEIWNSTWEFQATARSLRPIIDRLPENVDKRNELFIERHKVFAGSVKNFRDIVMKNQPFIPPHVYEICLSLRNIVIDLKVDFELSFENDEEVDWRKINECGKKLDEKLEELNGVIRDHIYGKLH